MPTPAQNREAQSRRNIIGYTKEDLDQLPPIEEIDLNTLLSEIAGTRRLTLAERKKKMVSPARRSR